MLIRNKFFFENTIIKTYWEPFNTVINNTKNKLQKKSNSGDNSYGDLNYSYSKIENVVEKTFFVNSSFLKCNMKKKTLIWDTFKKRQILPSELNLCEFFFDELNNIWFIDLKHLKIECG